MERIACFSFGLSATAAFIIVGFAAIIYSELTFLTRAETAILGALSIITGILIYIAMQLTLRPGKQQ